MEQLQRIYDNLKDDAEIAIIERYGNNAKYYTITLTSKIFSLIYLIVF